MKDIFEGVTPLCSLSFFLCFVWGENASFRFVMMVNLYFIRVVQAIYCCAQSVKIHDTRTDSHLSYHKSSSRSKILKIQSCLRVPLPRSIFTTMAIKWSSLIEKFWLKNPTSNASNDLNFRNIFMKWTKIWDKTLFEILPPEG